MRKVLPILVCVLALAAAASAQPVTNISYLRTLMDPVNYLPTDTTNLYTAEGIVTTHTNLTTSGNGQFYMQDATAGIAVFVNGGSTIRPAAGDRVRVTGPLGHFNGLFELNLAATNSAHVVSNLSSGNPLPTPANFTNFQLTNNTAAIEAIEGSYLVVSNVFLDVSTPSFSSSTAGSNVTMTNQAGDVFVLRVDGRTDIVGKPKPTGPVTILGVMGQFDNADPRNEGYQFIPSRFADLISATKPPATVFTNLLTNLVRPGDSPSNTTFKEFALRTGETLTIQTRSFDLDGSNITINPITAGLPPGATWSFGDTSGTSVLATFTYTAAVAQAGMPILVMLEAYSSRGTNKTTWNVYVPTLAEQAIVISEFLANPESANTNSPNFNPLHRPAPGSTNAFADDEYVEVVNTGASEVELIGWTLFDDVQRRHEFGDFFPLAASSAMVMYGGRKNFDPAPVSLPVPSVPFSDGVVNLSVFNNGADSIILRNGSGNLVARVVYTSVTSTNGISLTRHPTLNDGFVAHDSVVCTNASPGLQPDQRSFSLPVVLNPNAPTISDITNRTIMIDTSTGAIDFTVGDVETAAGSLAVGASSSNPTLVPPGGIMFGGGGSARTITITPAAGQSGVATITVTVIDAGLRCASDTFVLTVLSANNAPSLSAIPNQQTAINTPTAPIPFTIGDIETAAGSLTVSGASGNQTLLPDANITFGGSGSNRTVTLTPAPNQIGTAVVTVAVSDGVNVTSNSFNLVVNYSLLLCDKFDYPAGSLITNSMYFWTNHSGTTGQTMVANGNVLITGSQSEDVNAPLTNAPYAPGNGTLYASLVITLTNPPTAGGSYFAHFKDASTGFRGRIFSLLGGAAPGKFRLALGNGSAAVITNTTDLSLNTPYRIVTRYSLTGTNTTLWIDPVVESDPSVTAMDGTSGITVTSYALRQAAGIGAIFIDEIKVGTTFAAVVTPELAIVQVGANVAVSWPAPSTGFVLQGTPELGPGANWQNVSETPVESGGRKVVTLIGPTGIRFFRLIK